MEIDKKKSTNKAELELKFFISCDSGNIENIKTLSNSLDDMLQIRFNKNHFKTFKEQYYSQQKEYKLSKPPYNFGVNGFMLACRSGHFQIISDFLAILEKNKNILQILNMVDDEDWNCLHYACFNGHLQIIERLIKYQINRDLISLYEKATPLQFAQHRQFLSITKLFGENYSVEKLSPQKIQNIKEKIVTKFEKNVKLKKQPFLCRYALTPESVQAYLQYVTVSEESLKMPSFDIVLNENVLIYCNKNYETHLGLLQKITAKQKEKESKLQIYRASAISTFMFIIICNEQD